MSYENIIVEKAEGCARVTLNRPQVKNCLNTQTLTELERAFDDIERDGEVKVAVLTGSGGAFCSGADLKELRGLDPDRFATFIRLFHRVCNKIEGLQKPVIAAINAVTLAGGLEVAMSCDLRVAAEDAQLGDHHANFGGIPGGGGTQRLPRLVGMGRAKDILLTGRWLDAREAERIGLVNRVAPAGKLDETVAELVQSLVSKSPASMSAIKGLVNHGMQTDIATGLELEILAITQRPFGSPGG
ncbi:MAG: enoyl-CoA hydratase/isomerase family protein [Chloroflexota bacterium]|nr:enoyl-CoA hydratase/isomerase family protein [Chloroflexota bacterium]